MSRQIVEADLTWTGDAFEPGARIAVDGEGWIAEVGALQEAPTRRLEGQALLPGFVSAHSHAFQRGLRGRGERFPGGTGTFWTWREAMYDLVLSLDQSRFVELCTRAFQEMRDAGVTTVGEFHYFHHTSGTDDWAFDEAVLEAARAAGIRIALLETFYQTGGIGRPLGPAQQRFRTSSLDGFWKQMDRLAATIDHRRESLGAAVHSIRAAGLEEIAAIHDEARRRNLVLHVHIDEQREEIGESLAVYGKPSMAVLTGLLPSADGVTAVHCTHTAPDDLRRFLVAGGRICVCPLTEANLGDGLPDLAAALDYEERLSLGTDSNARISLLEEIRWLEYGQRLRQEIRGVVVGPAGDTARRLLSAATRDGADALGIHTGAVEPGRWADFCTIDLAHPALAGVEPDRLLDAMVFGAGNEVIVATCVGGEWREPTMRSERQ